MYCISDLQSKPSPVSSITKMYFQTQRQLHSNTLQINCTIPEPKTIYCSSVERLTIEKLAAYRLQKTILATELKK